MLAVVAVDEDRSRQIPDCCNEADCLVTGYAVVADWEVDVPQPVASCYRQVGLGAIDADDRPDSQPLKCLEALLDLGLSTVSRRGLSRKTFSMPGVSIRWGCDLCSLGDPPCCCWEIAPSVTRARRIDETILPSTINDPPGDLRETAKLGLTWV
jgi:hypothetical protein